MHITGQGVHHGNSFTRLFYLSVLIVIFCFTTVTYASNRSHEKQVLVVYNVKNQIQSKLARTIKQKLETTKNGPVVILATDIHRIKLKHTPDLIISTASQARKKHPGLFKRTPTLYIAVTPNKNEPVITGSSHKNAVLYMTQPYCRQISFITGLNPDWKTIAYLKSSTNDEIQKQLERCARKYDATIQTTYIDTLENLSTRLKQALSHADLLLALPDKQIYNSGTAKNILLSSYRMRKPVIAFSSKFVEAGALGALYSDVSQIADRAADIAISYLARHAFKQSTYYPEKFNISLNHQVFKALDISIPDTDELNRRIRKSISMEQLK